MWIFGKSGFVALEQHPNQPEKLLIRTLARTDMDNFVSVLDEAGDGEHEIREICEGDYRFIMVADKSAVAQAVGRLVARIDYAKFQQAVSVDFGQDSDDMVWVTRSGVQVAKLLR